ncbi:hypothetical protein [Clostridium tagluense]|uniref:Uncharacterized protein n=1 Tax=Clostridium tagluense TaxID=360422 RepID=A0A401UQD3_9CLOT|nr:hypothetical protein [Clostridium tagluense]GCD11721.1 hypothetical protein Ctaglu_33440 [Clostridium tagluense]
MYKGQICVVDFILKDNKGELWDCVIFDKDEKGQMSIQDENIIHKRLTDKNRDFTFQNRCTHGYMSAGAIKRFSIHLINGRDF